MIGHRVNRLQPVRPTTATWRFATDIDSREAGGKIQKITGRDLKFDGLDMKNYYRKRAPVYDDVYAYPERQQDLRFLEDHVARKFTGKEVVEVAAGTGYWTQFIATGSRSVLATDMLAEPLEQVKNRAMSCPVGIKIVDAYDLPKLGRKFNGAFAGLWISHVPKQRLSGFLQSLQQVLEPGSSVLFIDNSTAQCVRLPLAHVDEAGNTYQDRQLEDGTTHRILKNFPTENELETAITGLGCDTAFRQLEHFWLCQYTSR